MRKRLRKKRLKAKTAASKKLFNLRKALAIAELVIKTHQALNSIAILPGLAGAVQRFHIENSFNMRKKAIQSTIYRDDETIYKGVAIPFTVIGKRCIDETKHKVNWPATG